MSDVEDGAENGEGNHLWGGIWPRGTVMSAVATIDPEKIRRLSTPETSSPSRLEEYARWAERWAQKVERRWPELPPEVVENTRLKYREALSLLTGNPDAL